MTTKQLFYLVVALIVASGILFALGGCMPNYSNGVRTGYIVKLSQKGLFNKSWEGELLVSTPPGTTQMQPERFFFSVAEDTSESAMNAFKKGVKVDIVYRQWAVAPPWSQDTGYTVVAVHPSM